MNDVNKNLGAFHLSIDELLKALARSEDDVKNGRTAPISETFEALRKTLRRNYL